MNIQRVSLCLWICILSTVSYADPVSLENSYKKAVDYYRQGQYPKAQKALSSLVTKHWNNYDIVLLAGYNSWKMGRIRWAVSNFRRAMELRPDLPEPRIAIIRMYIATHQIEPAGRLAFESLQRFPKSWRLANQLALIHIKKKKWNEAIVYAEKAISLNEENYRAYNLLGLIYLQNNNLDLAAIAFKSAESIAPKSSFIQNNLGVVYEKQGKYKDASIYYKKALALNAFHPTAGKNLQRVRALTHGQSR